MTSLISFLAQQSQNKSLCWYEQLQLARQFKVSVAEVEAAALKHDIVPLRYRENNEIVTAKEQEIIFFSHVAIIGCGKLGGYVVEGLSQRGVGHLTLFDSGVIEEATISEQPFFSPYFLGRNKADIAARRVKEINPAVTVSPVVQSINLGNGYGLLAGSQVVIDTLDAINYRLMLRNVCDEMDLTLVNGLDLRHCKSPHCTHPECNSLQSPDFCVTKRDYSFPQHSPAVLAELLVSTTLNILLGR